MCLCSTDSTRYRELVYLSKWRRGPWRLSITAPLQHFAGVRNQTFSTKHMRHDQSHMFPNKFRRELNTFTLYAHMAVSLSAHTHTHAKRFYYAAAPWIRYQQQLATTHRMVIATFSSWMKCEPRNSTSAHSNKTAHWTSNACIHCVCFYHFVFRWLWNRIQAIEKTK